MLDHLFIGPCPCDEDCAQIGVTEGAARLNRLECEAYIEALRRVYGPEPEGAYLHIKTESHDFGAYREVVCYYEDDKREAVEYAFKVESGLATWAEAEMTAPVLYDRNHQSLGIAA
jgi:hypothetical protein